MPCSDPHTPHRVPKPIRGFSPHAGPAGVQTGVDCSVPKLLPGELCLAGGHRVLHNSSPLWKVGPSWGNGVPKLDQQSERSGFGKQRPRKQGLEVLKIGGTLGGHSHKPPVSAAVPMGRTLPAPLEAASWRCHQGDAKARQLGCLSREALRRGLSAPPSRGSHHRLPAPPLQPGTFAPPLKDGGSQGSVDLGSEPGFASSGCGTPPPRHRSPGFCRLDSMSSF